MEFVRHYTTRHDGVLPLRTSYATMPMVLADGALLAPTGLDRARGIQFLIPDALRAIIPRQEDCTQERVKAAVEFLCDQWLVDVATDFTGKATLIALALTLIERILLTERPCFSITAGRRGNGKTTTIIMLIKAVTGETAAAAAWSPSEEERRKSIMAYFLRGSEYILWDNIPRGMQISCPHIERSCTAATYTDRVLGVSETPTVSAATIHIFTGNNIGAKGDLASRTLNIRLGVDRADPENREFKHTDPVGWTMRHRGEILSALYTVLLGNPQLKEAHDAGGKTRFKLWWRLVGSAVEHAMKLAELKAASAPKAVGETVDFQTVFLAHEQDEDEDTASLFDVLDILQREYPTREFTAAAVTGLINFPSGDDGRSLREFLTPGAEPHFVFSPRNITRALKRHVDEPVKRDARTLVLRKQRDAHSKVDHYRVDSL